LVLDTIGVHDGVGTGGLTAGVVGIAGGGVVGVGRIVGAGVVAGLGVGLVGVVGYIVRVHWNFESDASGDQAKENKQCFHG